MFARCFLLTVLSTACLSVPSFALSPASKSIEFNRDVRPILSENCFPCHGTDSASRKGGLRLDRFEDATAPAKDGKIAIVPSKCDASELVRRINATDDDQMPPKKTKKILTAAQKDLLKQWIVAGAKYQPHWSYIPPQKPIVPEVKNKNWIKNPIDNFILARLETEKLKPNAEADRRTLARRVSLDLTGLPPRPEDLDAFLKDKSPNAYEKFVDHLLSSPAWGEHRARYWLDAARYADTHGIHLDFYREIWPYRDWVINAFNTNKPFDQFTVEQIAGDLLPNPTMEQQIATGFNRCNITTSEGGAIDAEYLVLYARDRTETTSQVFLGLTTGCAVCHDHKFDRITQTDFYSLSAFFNNTTQKAMDGNIRNTPPIIVVPKAEDRARWEALPAAKIAADKQIKSRRKDARPEYKTFLTTAKPDAFGKHVPTDEPAFHALLADKDRAIKYKFAGTTNSVTLATNTAWQDGVIAEKAFTTSSKNIPRIKEAGDFDNNQPYSISLWVKLSSLDGTLVSRMDDTNGFTGWDFRLEAGRPAAHLVHKWPDDAWKVIGKKALVTNRWTHVCLTYDGANKAGGVKFYIDGQSQEIEVAADKLQNTTRTTVPLSIGQRNTTSPLEKAGLQDLRFYTRVLKPEEVTSLGQGMRSAWLLSKPADKRSKSERSDLYDSWLAGFDKKYQELTAALGKLNEEEAAIKARSPETHVMHERTNAPEAYVLIRGEYTKPKDRVTPETPAALPPMVNDWPKNRLGLAKWIVAPENPLTARVTVNRFWQEVFGTGIVRTTGDLGVSGEMPSHPELLDWLAIDFREHGWDVKRCFKQLVMSATYRQAATVSRDKLDKDPDNRLLARGPRFRMDAEMIRDYALATSGLLVRKIGGPSVKPYQPPGVWESIAMIGSDTREYKQDTGEKLYRRSLYTFWKRTAPPASMEIFNAPSRETCTVRRERTDTPLQALAALDDTQLVEAARNLAQTALKQTKPDKAIDFIAENVLERPLKPEERKVTTSVYNDLLKHYQTAPKDAVALIAVGESKADPKLDQPTLAAYTMVANQMMNLDEVLNK
ncbi:MAG: DUF1553 domain-containing protein [Limisphaerales bacterium]